MKTFLMWVGIAFIVLIIVSLFVSGSNTNMKDPIAKPVVRQSVEEQALEDANAAMKAEADIAAQTAADEATAAAAAAGATDTPEQSQPGFTVQQMNAIRSAKSYLDFSGFSRKGLIKQLSSEHGEGYSVEDATIAVDSLDVDWNEQAARSAQQYLDFQGFSCKGLIKQLSSPHGEKYTEAQATYGAQKVGACS
ncbi:Ltp family lipoprotein [Acinetobacter baumannii]